MIKAGDRVVFPHTAKSQKLLENHPKLFPPMGTEGTVYLVCPEGVRVIWDGAKCIDAPIEHNDVEKIGDRTIEQNIKDSGDRTEFSTGAVRDMHTGKGRMDLLPWKAIMAVSKHCENGAIKYGEHNVDRGIPAHSLIDSGMRHAAKFISGETDEDHLLAAVWNFLWLLEMRTTHPELMDIPWRPKDEQEKE
jgi:hypothetical protein